MIFNIFIRKNWVNRRTIHPHTIGKFNSRVCSLPPHPMQSTSPTHYHTTIINQSTSPPHSSFHSLIMAIFIHPIDHVKNKHSIFVLYKARVEPKVRRLDEKTARNSPLSHFRRWKYQQLLITIIFWLKYILSLSHNDSDRFSL